MSYANVLVIVLLTCSADAETEPCVVSTIGQDVFLSLVNPRSSGDSKVMLNLPFSRVFCSPPVARYLLVGEWNQQNLLKLNSTQLHFGISGFPIDLKTFDVTLNSSSTAFDFMIDSGRSQLIAGADHFAALTSCNTVYCRTVGPVKFRPWRTSSVPNKIIIGASSGGVVLLILSLIAISLVVVVIVKRRNKTEESVADRGEIIVPENEPHPYVKPKTREEIEEDDYDEIMNTDDSGVGTATASQKHTSDIPMETITGTSAGSSTFNGAANPQYPGGRNNLSVSAATDAWNEILYLDMKADSASSRFFDGTVNPSY